VLSHRAALNRSRHFIALIFIYIALPLLVQGNGLKIKFLNTGISDTTEYNGLPADFPYPVLSLIQIQDYYHHYVHGLAAMDEWLGPGDISESGVPVDDIWKVIRERHAYNDLYPENQNVKEMEPNYLVAELSSVAGYGVSMALAMDYSGSMGNGIYEAEAAAKLLVRRINKNDKVAIAKIINKTIVYQDFTSDTTLLMEAITTPTPNRSGTALNEGIYETVELCKNVTGRRCVVVYTDGLNDMPGPSAQEIIDLAKELGVTIFTIGLGDEIDEEDLGEIAIETGGYYRRTPSPSSLGLIYKQIYDYINGFYALAHTSTDPYFNGTWRRIDVQLEYPSLKGSGWGTYYVPFLPRNVRIQNKVVSDSMMVDQGDTLYLATSDDQVSYTITIDCDGPGIARDIVVKNVLDPNVVPISYEWEPDIIIGDTLIWNIIRMNGGTRKTIRYDAQVATYLPMHTVELINRGFVNCPFDSVAEDNEAQSILLAKGHPDFQIHCQPNTKLLSPGHPLTLNACLSNYGNADADVPVNIRFRLGSPDGQLIDELSVNALSRADSTWITGIWKHPTIGTYDIYFIVDEENAIKELQENNNRDSCIIQVGIDALDIEINEIGFHNQIRNKQAIFPDPMIMKINIVDQNTHTVFGLADTNSWIDLVQIAESGEPAENHWTGLYETSWTCSGSQCRTDILENVQVTEIRQDTLSIVFVADISNSMAGWRQQAQRDLLSVFNPDFQDWGAVVGLGETVQTLQTFTQDTSLLFEALESGSNTQKRMVYDGCIQGVSLAGSREGRRGIVVLVSGKEQGGSHSLEQVIESVQNQNVPIYIVQIGSSPYNQNYQLLADTTGGWYFQVTRQDESESVAVLLEDLLRNYYCLSFASPDTLFNESLRTVEVEVSAYNLSDQDAGVYRSPAGIADLKITKKGRVTNRYLTQTDSVNRVQPGDTIFYSLSIENQGQYDLDDITIQDDLPENLQITESSLPYQQTDSNQIQWSIGSLSVYQSTGISYTCFVDTIYSAVELINQATIIHSKDDVPENNTARDTVVFIPLEGPDLSIAKTSRVTNRYLTQTDPVNQVQPGDTIFYSLSIENPGQFDLYNITVQDDLPENLQITESSLSYQQTDSNQIEWIIDSLLVYQSTGISYTCFVDTIYSATELINRAAVIHSSDVVPENNTARDTVVFLPLKGPDLSITKASQVASRYLSQTGPVNRVQPGDTIFYSLSIENPGQFDLYNITIQDDLPENLQITESSLLYQQTDLNQIQWIIDSLLVYQSTGITYTCFVDTAFKSSEFHIINQAVVIHSKDVDSDNNTARDTILCVPLKGPDLHIYKSARADSFKIFQQDTIWIADPGDTVSYTIDIVNEGEILCRDITLSDTLSKWLTFISDSEDARLQDNTLHWSINPLASRGGSKQITYTCAVDTFLPPWDEIILNQAIVTSPNDTFPDNNTITDTLWVTGVYPPGPQIQTSKDQVQPGDSLTVSAMSPIIIEGWDLIVFYEDGSMIVDYGDAFIESNPLQPGQWVTVTATFDDTYMRSTEQKEELIGFIVETTDIWGSVRSDTTFITIRSSDSFSLDRNVFRLCQDPSITLNFKLSSNRHANIKIFDISGHHIKDLASRSFLAGWNDIQWDGQDDHGRIVGSGVYLAVLDAGEYKKAHKFIIVR